MKSVSKLFRVSKKYTQEVKLENKSKKRYMVTTKLNETSWIETVNKINGCTFTT